MGCCASWSHRLEAAEEHGLTKTEVQRPELGDNWREFHLLFRSSVLNFVRGWRFDELASRQAVHHHLARGRRTPAAQS